MNMKSTPMKIVMFAVALSVFFVIYFVPTPADIHVNDQVITLSMDAKAVLATLAFAVILWISEALPFPVTGLFALVILVMTQVVTFKQAVQDSFGNSIVLFFIGVLIFSAAFSETNLLRRLTSIILYHLGHKPKMMVLAILTMGMLLAGGIVEMAVAAIMLPIGVGILKDAKLEPLKSNFGRAIMISCAWGPIMGGICTPVGSGTNPLTIGFMHDLAGIDFTFINWMTLGYPAAIMMLPFAWLILIKTFPLEDVDLRISAEDLRERFVQMGPVHRKEIFTILIFAFTMVLWITAPWIKKWSGGCITYLSISFIAIACSCLLFLPGIEVMTWKKAEKAIAWGGVILIVTGLALGMSLYKTGGAEWLAWIMFSKIGALHPVARVFAIVLGVSLIKVMFSSNTVTGIIIVPLLIALAKTLGLDPLLLAIPAGLTSALAFLLVTSSPTNVIPYSAGYFTIKDMAKAGIWMTLASSVCVTISITVIGKITGIVTW